MICPLPERPRVPCKEGKVGVSVLIEQMNRSSGPLLPQKAQGCPPSAQVPPRSPVVPRFSQVCQL